MADLLDRPPGAPAPQRHPLRHRLAERGVDWTLLLLLLAVAVIAALFLYPFIYGVSISFQPMEGGSPFANYTDFFGDSYQAVAEVLACSVCRAARGRAAISEAT
ncbi:hypothetical protein ACWEWQ_41880, partial [Streptomyces sp. NPDC003832]